MFFQAISKKQIERDTEKDLYEQLQFVVVTLLNRELPSHYAANHILYTANLRLEELKELASYHRKRINLYSSIGQFHKEAYDLAIKNTNQLQLLIDSYITLHIDTDRERINHRLSFKDDVVIALYNELIDFKKAKVQQEMQELFWKAYKQDLMPLLAELR
ncbi:putative protein OS=Ureibacillus acetophenoni OX=614649 GN=SAMN05877842_102238 PE=4 SV=1 [Ureibacillus acetophenoni]